MILLLTNATVMKKMNFKKKVVSAKLDVIG